MSITTRFAFVLLLACSFSVESVQAQRSCGTAIRYEYLGKNDPAQLLRIREAAGGATEAMEARRQFAASKTTGQFPIPVVFHFILTPDQYDKLGQDSGIIRRVKSQMRCLNEDFNRGNADSNLIPAPFKPLFGNVDIQFGVTNVSSPNTLAPGIEVKILPNGANPIYDVNNDCYIAKEATANGLPAWDVSRFLNIWVVNITAGGSGMVLGITTPPSSIGQTFGGHTITPNELGLVMNYGAFGVREFAAQYFENPFDRGRTLTHEMGHFFELWHTWGDDFGACPTGSINDDFVSDTPPEGDATYCDKPPGGKACPVFPYYDNCHPSKTGNGVMFMNFMDYVDDRAMQMFTVEQAARMQGFLASQSYSLTQNPHLLSVGRTSIPESAFRVFPNPARDAVEVSITGREKLLGIDVVNLVGQRLLHLNADGRQNYRIPLGDLARGIYFIQCRFAEGALTKKIVVE